MKDIDRMEELEDEEMQEMEDDYFPDPPYEHPFECDYVYDPLGRRT